VAGMVRLSEAMDPLPSITRKTKITIKITLAIESETVVSYTRIFEPHDLGFDL